MTKEEFAALVRSWGRLPEAYGTAAAARADGERFDAHALGAALVATLAFGLGADGAGQEAAARLVLEEKDRDGVPGETRDPLTSRERAAMHALCGSTIGMRSGNGYLDFAEAAGQAMQRIRTCSSARLEGVRLEAWGDEFVGAIAASDGGEGRVELTFTRRGLPVPREGLRRSAEWPLSALAGFGYMLEGGETLARELPPSDGGPPPRRAKPGTKR
jgi:hypothetical protein